MAAKRSQDRVTLHDVAREAGVSVASASRALNGGDRAVSAEVEERVRAAAAVLRYVPNLSARAMKKGMTSSVGLIVGDIADPSFSAIASGVIQSARARQMTVTITASGRSQEAELEAVREMRRQGHRTIVVVGSRRVDRDEAGDVRLAEELLRFEETGGSVVFASQPSTGFSTVALDDVGGARALAMTLVGEGYRSFAVLSGDRGLATVEDRITGFTAGLRERGIELPPERIVTGAFSRDGGYDTATRLGRTSPAGIDLVFATSDVMAIGAMAAFRDSGVEVGREIGLAGFDDIGLARLLTPGLTTVSAHLALLGQQTIDLALDASGVRIVRELATSVTLRESTPRRML